MRALVQSRILIRGFFSRKRHRNPDEIHECESQCAVLMACQVLAWRSDGYKVVFLLDDEWGVMVLAVAAVATPIQKLHGLRRRRKSYVVEADPAMERLLSVVEIP